MKTSAQRKTFMHKRKRSFLRFWQITKIGTELSSAKPPSGQLTKQRCHTRLAKIKAVLRRGTRVNFLHTGTFQEAIGPVLVLAQIFALMPVKGVTHKSAQDLSFSWRNLRTYYALLVIVLFGVSSCFTIAFTSRGKFDFDSVEAVVFYVSIFCISCAFFHLARKWPSLQLVWQDVEAKLPPLRSEREQAALSQHIKGITIVATVCSFVEHLLSVLGVIYYANACPVIPNHPIESYLYINFSSVFYFIEYSNFMGILGKIINVLCTFAWNFNDIFVMAVSVALAARFRQLNDHMQRAARSPTSMDFWIQNRVNYRNLCKLCDVVDDAISPITLLCFSNNLYFICGKILKSLQKKPSLVHTLYFWFSLVYLLGRTFILSIYSASINDESKRPLDIFRVISREYWCPELKRFSDEVAADSVALSGMKFFQLTRGVVISVAGTIVTYELILLQFNKDDKVNDCYES